MTTDAPDTPGPPDTPEATATAGAEVAFDPASAVAADPLLALVADEAVLAQRAQHDQFPMLDGLRLVGALSVLACHVVGLNFSAAATEWGAYLNRGDTGAVLFFLISGFLIYRPFLDAILDGRRAPSTRSFLWRRAIRIYPSYWVALGLTGVVLGYVSLTPRSVLAFVTLTHTYFANLVYGPTTHGPRGGLSGPLVVTWTMALDVAFYVFVLVLAAVLGRLSRQRSLRTRWAIQLATLAAMYVGGWLFRWWAVSSHDRTTALRYLNWLPANTDAFAVGMGFAVAVSWMARGGGGDAWLRCVRSRWFPMACWLAAAVSLVLLIEVGDLRTSRIFFTHSQDVWGCPSEVLVAAFLFAPAVFGVAGGGGLRRALSRFPLRDLGLASLGLYLWQDVFIEFYLRWTHDPDGATRLAVAFPVLIVACLLAGIANFVVVERTFLKLRNWGPGRSRSKQAPAGPVA